MGNFSVGLNLLWPVYFMELPPIKQKGTADWVKCHANCVFFLYINFVCLCLSIVGTLKFRNFWTLYSFCSQIKYWFQGANSQNVCQNIKQGRPWPDCFLRSCLVRVCTVCLAFLAATGVRNFWILVLCPKKCKYLFMCISWKKVCLFIFTAMTLGFSGLVPIIWSLLGLIMYSVY